MDRKCDHPACSITRQPSTLTRGLWTKNQSEWCGRKQWCQYFLVLCRMCLESPRNFTITTTQPVSVTRYELLFCKLLGRNFIRSTTMLATDFLLFYNYCIWQDDCHFMQQIQQLNRIRGWLLFLPPMRHTFQFSRLNEQLPKQCLCSNTLQTKGTTRP